MTTTYAVLQYDIRKDSGVANPSGRLRRRAIRTSLSVWVMPADRLPHALLHSWTCNGVRWHVIEFAAHEGQKVLEMCRAALQKEIEATEKSLQKSITRARKKMEEAPQNTVNADRFQATVETAHRRLIRQLEAFRAAATTFGLEVAIDPTENSLGALLTAAHQRAALYAQMVEAVQGTALEAAANDSDVPAQILADFIEDQTGADMSAMHGAFSGTP